MDGAGSFQMNQVERGLNDPFLLKFKEIRLYDYHDIPYFLRGNPHVTSGYRAFLSFRMCIKSLFVLSNETINIWSHLLGFLYFIYLAFYDNFVYIPDKNGSFPDHLVVSALLIGFQVCMFSSAGYHMFCCHSEKVYHLWLALDLAGVSLGLSVCYIPSIYYAYYCEKALQALYLTGATLITFISLVLQLHPSFLTSRWAKKRLFVFCSLVAYGIIPCVHWVYLNGGWNQDVVRIFIPRVVVMYILGILALAFYGLKIPESWLPGQVNYIGSSHQWWHLFIVLAYSWWHSTNISYMEYRLQNQCEHDESLQFINTIPSTSGIYFLA